MRKTPESLGDKLRKRYERQRAEWAESLLHCEPIEPVYESLSVSRTEIYENLGAYEEWERCWLAAAAASGGSVVLATEEANLSLAGRTDKLAGVQVSMPEGAFALMPSGWASQHIFSRALRRLSDNPDLSDALLDEKRFVFDATDSDFARLCATVRWLKDHRPVNSFIRELPIPGIDTKWLERHTRVVCAMLTSVLGLPEPLRTADFLERWQIRAIPELIDVRHADTLIPGLMHDSYMKLPLAELERHPVRRICVVENLQTGLSLDVPEDVLIVLGKGYSIEALGRISWTRNAQILYMGDLDAAGLSILAVLRSKLPAVRSVLMTVETLSRYGAFAVADPTAASRPVERPAEHLTTEELFLFDRLSSRGLRLEQERIPIQVINEAFAKALANS